MGSFTQLLVADGVALTEGSVFERLRREPALAFDPDLAHAALIYDERGRNALERVHREYLDVGVRHRLPTVILTDTWRGNRERIERSIHRGRKVNQDCASFLCEIRDSVSSIPVFVGGISGCRGDA